MTLLVLSKEKKVKVAYRVEAGCLGPQGTDHIDGFCKYAQEHVQTLDSDYVTWQIEPRTDKRLPEMQYSVMGKRMSHEQTERYLQALGKSLEEFERHLGDRMAYLIENYMRSEG